MANPSTRDTLKAKYRLSPKQIGNIGSIIIADYTAGARPMEKPTVVILGGQPGAGKGELITVASALLKQNAVICNADDFRDYHPEAQEIKAHHETQYPDITVEYSQPWAVSLKKHCIKYRYNFILETTFSDPNLMKATIQELKAAGFEVVLMVLSVNKKLSYLGTKIRYEEMKATTGYGRLVDRDIHDNKYDLVPETLAAVQTQLLYDKLFIYGRAGGQNLKGKRRGLILLSENGEHPIEDYLKERDKEWTDNDMRYFNNDVLYLLKRMVQRKAEHAEMAEIFEIFEVGLPPKPKDEITGNL